MFAIITFYFRGGKATPQECTLHSGAEEEATLKFLIGTSIFYCRFGFLIKQYVSINRKYTWISVTHEVLVTSAIQCWMFMRVLFYFFIFKSFILDKYVLWYYG